MKDTILIGKISSNNYIRWLNQFNALKEFYKNNGHVGIKKEENPKLYRWAATQKRKYPMNELSDERIELLKSIGFVFNVHDAQWFKNFKDVELICKEKGFFHITPRRRTKKLYIWCCDRRKKYINNELSDERIELLKSIGFVFNVHDIKWLNQFNALKEFYKNNGRFIKKEENLILYTWCCNQRKKYRENKLDDEKIELLKSIGLIF